MPALQPGDDLAFAATLLSLGRISSDALPNVAVRAMESGMDSEALRELAGLVPIDPRDARDLFDKTLRELNVVPVPEDEARWWIALQYASWILDGTVSPHYGAALIWRAFMGREYPEVIAEFILLEEQWYGGRNRRRTRREIAKQARRLLTTSGDSQS